LKSKAWRERAAEAASSKKLGLSYNVEIAKLIEIGTPWHERDALETVLTAARTQEDT
jgi:hypothetical protein